jgi:hypothetical protein
MSTGSGAQQLSCLDAWQGEECDGPVERRPAMSPTGVWHPRCERHFAIRLDRQRGIEERYPQHAPADFDPTYAGESWDEEPW